VLTLKAVADKAKDICSTVSNSLSADHTKHPGWYLWTKWTGTREWREPTDQL